MARRTKYRDEYAQQARYICETWGATNEQLADCLNCSRSSLTLWMREHAEFSSAIKEGRRAFDSANVEASLVACACGFYYQEEQINPKTGDVVPLWRYHVPQYKQQMAWLANRQGWHWPAPPVVPARRSGSIHESQDATAIPDRDQDNDRYQRLVRDILAERYHTRLKIPESRDAKGKPSDN